MKKFTLPLIILVVVLVSVSGCVNVKTNNTTQNNSSNQINVKNSSSDQTNITAAEAQNIASKFIEQEGATAGTPRLITIDGQKVYVVPIIYNGQTVGQIEIDAQTGANMGGAGGVT